MLSIAVVTLAERKVLSVTQNRVGPDKVGTMGILQPIADGVKLILKETVIPGKAWKVYYKLSPEYGIIISMWLWYIVPLTRKDRNNKK